MAAEQRKLLGMFSLLWSIYLHSSHLQNQCASSLPPWTKLTAPSEQLMGAGASSRSAKLSITDPKVCRSYLVGTCPHDLFTNTKQDLGPCPKVHSEPLKTEYESTKDTKNYGFEYDYMRDLQKYIDECNRRIDA